MARLDDIAATALVADVSRETGLPEDTA